MPYRVQLPSEAVPLRIFFYDGPIARAVSFLNACSRMSGRLVERLKHKLPPMTAGRGTNCSTSRPTANPTDIILRTGIWLWPTPSKSSKPGRTPRLDCLWRNFWNRTRRLTKSNSIVQAPGAVRTASADGSVIAVAIPAATPAGINPGASRCAMLWIGCGIKLLPQFEKRGRRELFKDPWAARDDYINVKSLIALPKASMPSSLATPFAN